MGVDSQETMTQTRNTGRVSRSSTVGYDLGRMHAAPGQTAREEYEKIEPGSYLALRAFPRCKAHAHPSNALFDQGGR